MKWPLHLLLPSVKGIPVLMYHHVWPGQNDRLTIAPEQLEQHFAYLKEQGYEALHLSEFLAMAKGDVPLREKVFLLTFDDGYHNHLQYAYPLIQQFDFKASFFIIGQSLSGDTPDTAAPKDQKMNATALAQLDPETIQLALHSQAHIHFKETPLSDIRVDLAQNIAAFDQSGLPYHKVLAYPYGGRKKGASERHELQAVLAQLGIEAAFRIGNQPCAIPASDLYELKRIDIWGTDTMAALAIKLKKGKLKPF